MSKKTAYIYIPKKDVPKEDMSAEALSSNPHIGGPFISTKIIDIDLSSSCLLCDEESNENIKSNDIFVAKSYKVKDKVITKRGLIARYKFTLCDLHKKLIDNYKTIFYSVIAISIFLLFIFGIWVQLLGKGFINTIFSGIISGVIIGPFIGLLIHALIVKPILSIINKDFKGLTIISDNAVTYAKIYTNEEGSGYLNTISDSSPEYPALNKALSNKKILFSEGDVIIALSFSSKKVFDCFMESDCSKNNNHVFSLDSTITKLETAKD